MDNLLDQILARLDAMPPEQIAALEAKRRETAPLWVPNPGGQTAALQTEAYELFFGGGPGGGKSSCLVGLAVGHHQQSIIFRREFPQIKGLEDETARILGNRDGYNAQKRIWRLPPTPGMTQEGRTLEFGSVPHETDKESYQGRAHDLKGFDEITHFTRSQYEYLTLWVRSTDPAQRCRIVATGNPPTSATGWWVIERWGPWLDAVHPTPAKPGELLYPCPREDDRTKEVFFKTLDEAMRYLHNMADPPRDHRGQIVPPRSRTFIPGYLSENPDLERTGYGQTLAYAASGLSHLAKGQFDAAVEDPPDQVIPTGWIIAAQKRWTPAPPKGTPMSAIGVDVAQGGADRTVLAPRNDYWYGPVVAVPGAETPQPSHVAGLVVMHRRDNAAIIVDCGGGYGGGVVERLNENNVPARRYNGADASGARTKDRSLSFMNKRAETWWRFREALDPDQPGGSPIMIPDDPEIRSDLAAPRFRVGPRGIQIEDKAETKKRIGRSPDKGDAIVMCWQPGLAALSAGYGGSTDRDGGRPRRPTHANVGHAHVKTRRR